MIFKAVSIYLMAGFAFTRLYQFLAAVQPAVLDLYSVLNHHIVLSRFDLIYFSFGALTSLVNKALHP